MRTAHLPRAVLLAALATSAACGGRGIKADAGDGGGDAPGADVADVGTPPGTDAAPDRLDTAPDRADAAPDRTDTAPGIDTAAPPPPVCVNKPGAAPACGEAMCGNGKRESCAVMACSDGTISFPSEACDGADLAGVSCVGDGYGSGVVTCNSSCALERAGCRACAPLDTVLVACDELGIPAPEVNQVRLAATDTGAAVAWTGMENSPRAVTLSLARVAPTLEVLDVRTLESVPWPSGDAPSFRSVAVVPLGGGWLVGALADEERVILHTVDATGKDLGRVTLETVTGDDDSFARFVTLVARPTGGALAIWSAGGGMRAATVAADGLTIGPKTNYPLVDVANVSVSNAAWLGDAAYLVHTVTSLETWQHKALLVRFGVDGAAPRAVATIVNGGVAPLALAADADELLFSYGGPAPGGGPDDSALLLGRFDGQGRVTAAPVVTTGRALAVVPAGDDALLLSNGPGERSVNAERRARTGTAVGATRTILKLPVGGPSIDYSAARRGPETIVAWTKRDAARSRIGLVRLAQ